eukprot:COSAG02_NODE_68328_length_251_cov_0.447368_1_plen_43_part_10
MKGEGGGRGEVGRRAGVGGGGGARLGKLIGAHAFSRDALNWTV